MSYLLKNQTVRKSNFNVKRKDNGKSDGLGLDDHWNDAEGALAFLLRPAGLGNSRGSCNLPWYICGLGGIGNKSSDCASWIPPPSYSAT